MPETSADASQHEHGRKAGGQRVVAGGDSSTELEPADGTRLIRPLVHPLFDHTGGGARGPDRGRVDHPRLQVDQPICARPDVQPLQRSS